VSASFLPARSAAQAAASGQDYPGATLYIIATPIGNLADCSLRAIHVLSLVDVIACEDTRHSQALLRNLELDRSDLQWLPVHQHNELAATSDVLQHLKKGLRVAYLSDAGTPGISDPGSRLVKAALIENHRVMPIPGASSISTLLSASGGWIGRDSGFVFQGFLPAKFGEREKAIQKLAAEHRVQVIFEAPHRIESLAQSLKLLGSRGLTIGRELTKQFEEIACLSCEKFPAWLQANPQRRKGEFSLVLHEVPQEANPTNSGLELLQLLLPHLPLKTAVQLASEFMHVSKNELYEQALKIKNSQITGSENQ
jgi:16S rRNA (cytidine1402-2'-O)-methyltransferase